MKRRRAVDFDQLTAEDFRHPYVVEKDKVDSRIWITNVTNGSQFSINDDLEEAQIRCVVMNRIYADIFDYVNTTVTGIIKYG